MMTFCQLQPLFSKIMKCIGAKCNWKYRLQNTGHCFYNMLYMCIFKSHIIWTLNKILTYSRFRWKVRADFRLAPSQWETSLQSNAVFHWLGASLESVSAVAVADLAAVWWKRNNNPIGVIKLFCHQIILIQMEYKRATYNCITTFRGKLMML